MSTQNYWAEIYILRRFEWIGILFIILIINIILLVNLKRVKKLESSILDTALKGCGNCSHLWDEEACLGSEDGNACKDWRLVQPKKEH